MPIWSVNPVALAELILGEDLFLEKDPDSFGDALQRAFGTKLDAIFEAEGSAPARLDLFQQLAGAKIEERSSVDDLIREMVVKYGYTEDTIRQKILPYLLPVADAVFAPPDAPPPAGTGSVVGSWRPVAAAEYVGNDVSFLDPRQGVIADCYLISAMIALAWSRPAEWTARVMETSGEYRYTFITERVCEVREVKPQLPLDTKGKLLYARSSTGKAEVWPGMFEKAYVMSTLGLSDEPTPSSYKKIEFGEPQIACRTLLGGASKSELALGGPPLSDHVKARCGYPADKRGVTRVPTMAWTWDEGMIKAKGLKWRNTGLRKNHAYAVLGIMERENLEYVILRDPWGWVQPSAGHAKEDSWAPGPGANGLEVVKLHNVLEAKGVFGLQHDLFDQWFQAIGWVE
jgi:hypothetical protein